MSWHQITASGASRDLWVDHTGHGAPKSGRWITSGGLDVDDVLGRRGPDALDAEVWWEQQPGHSGRRLTDVLWQTSMIGLKLVSRSMLEVLEASGANLQVFDVDIRLHDGGQVVGYVGILEETEEPGPVHSLWRGRRSHDLVVSDDVLAALKAAGIAGLRVEPVDGPFPADRPGFFDD